MKKRLIKLYNSFLDKTSFTWLDGRSYSDAFVICLGAGPWRFNRRKNVQQYALDKLAGRDISEIKNNIDWYPLIWQNKFLRNLNIHINMYYNSMDDFCEEIIKTNNKKKLYFICTLNNYSYPKVLSLFCRDALKINTFPIDRHVRKFLNENKFFDNEDKMIDLCLKAGLNPSLVATAIVKNYGSVDNPDWFIKK